MTRTSTTDATATTDGIFDAATPAPSERSAPGLPTGATGPAAPDPREDFAGAWAATPVEVTSPNQQVRLTMFGDREVQVRLAPGWTGRVTRTQVVDQLSRVARLALAERTRRFLDLRSRETGRRMRPDRRLRTRADHAYAERADRIVATGASGDGEVTVSMRAATAVDVDLGPRWRDLDDATLGADIAQAAEAALADHAVQTWQLREDVYYAD